MSWKIYTDPLSCYLVNVNLRRSQKLAIFTALLELLETIATLEGASVEISGHHPNSKYHDKLELRQQCILFYSFSIIQ